MCICMGSIKRSNETGGPAQWAKAKLVRYADDLVVLARHQSRGLVGFIEKRLESGLALEINREKNACGGPEGTSSQSGLFGIHVPV